MKIRIILLVLGVAFLFTNTYGQKGDLEHVIIRNNPEDINNFRVKLNPVYADFYNPNINVGYDLGVDYNFNDLFIIKFDYKSAYFDRNKESEDNTSINESKALNNIDIMGQFVLFKEVYDGREEITLKEYTDVRYVTYIDAKKFKSYTLRLGVNTRTSFVGESSVVIEGSQFLKGKKVALQQGVEEIDGGTMMSSNNLVFGVSRIKRSDLKAKFNQGVGMRDFAILKELYIDFLYSYKMSLENMSVLTSVYVDSDGNIVEDDGNGQYEKESRNVEYAVDEYTAKNKFGLRVGFRTVSLKTFGVNYGAEIGSLPGPGTIKDNFYFSITFGLNLSTKI